MKELTLTDNTELTAEDVENLNVEKLKADLLKKSYILQFALFSQGSKEYDRIGKDRTVLNTLEAEIFKDEEIKKLDYFQKLALYRMVSSNLNVSLEFLRGLHSSMNDGLAAVNEIQKFKSEKPAERVSTGEIDRVKLDEVKKLIENKIRQRLEEKNGKA